ncbi:MAG: GNAT family N-acetyltransferase [Gemmatimonadetes bacterium]|nr:GNAT family N-acetyltransferase [Gemmatimonadota bacterium]
MTESGERIRRATPGDAPALAESAARWFDETFGAYNDPADMRMYLEKAFGSAQQSAELTDPRRTTLLAEDGDGLVGYAILHRTREGEAHPGVPAGEAVEIQRFYLDGRRHGRGLAGRLMDAAIGTARELGAEVVWLSVWEHNTRAVRFYEKSGFGDVGEVKFLLGTDLQRDRVMARSL